MKKSKFFFNELAICVDHALTNGKFPITLKIANVTPLYKKEDPTGKTNFWPVSVLPYYQLGKYMDAFPNKLLCRFRKAHYTQYALLKLLQWWQKELDNSGLMGTTMVDLSKAYDCLDITL